MKTKKVRLFISPKEIQSLLDYAHYQNAWQLHRTIRDSIATQPGNRKKRLTIQEFCTYMDLPYDSIFQALEELDF